MRRELPQYPVTLTGHSDRIHRKLLCARPTLGGLTFFENISWTRIGSRDRRRMIKGKIKEVAGKVLGDAKLESEGKADQAAGKVQNAVGGVKDTLKGK